MSVKHAEVTKNKDFRAGRQDASGLGQAGQGKQAETVGAVPRITLRDVARVAGVSRTTASYVLNGRRDMRISEDAQRRVRSAAASLGYRPNRNALSLRTARSMTVGLVTDFLGPHGFEVLSGASSACFEAGRLLVVGEAKGDPRVEVALVEEMLDRQVDGIVYATRHTSHVQAPSALVGHRAVLLNCRDDASGLPCILPDDRAAGTRLAAALLQAGHRARIWLVGAETGPHALAGMLRTTGLVGGLRAAGVELVGQAACGWTVPAAYDAVRGLLAEGPPPRALVCLDDRVAMGGYQALADAGLSVPGDVSVVSFGATELVGRLRPPVTTATVPYAALGREAVSELVQGGPPRTGVRLVPMPLRPGGSLRQVGSASSVTGSSLPAGG